MTSSQSSENIQPSGSRFFPSRTLPKAPGCAWVRTRGTVVGPAPLVKGLATGEIGVAARVWLVGLCGVSRGPFWEGNGDAEQASEAGAAWIGDRLDLNLGDAILRLPLGDLRFGPRQATPPDLELHPLEPPLRHPLDRLLEEADARLGRFTFCERVIAIGDRVAFHGVVEAVDPSMASSYRASANPGERFLVRPDLGPCTLRLLPRRELP